MRLSDVDTVSVGVTEMVTVVVVEGRNLVGVTEVVKLRRVVAEREGVRVTTWEGEGG